MPNGTYGGVRGWGLKAPAYSIGAPGRVQTPGGMTCLYGKNCSDGSDKACNAVKQRSDECLILEQLKMNYNTGTKDDVENYTPVDG
jgi:hypothetical protein